MDPNTTLARLTELLDSFAVDRESGDAEAIFDRLSEACDVFDGLKGWISRGGALPDEWVR